MKGRISFNEQDATHIYEWLCMYWRDESVSYEVCGLCERIGKRLEAFIGPTEVQLCHDVVKVAEE